MQSIDSIIEKVRDDGTFNEVYIDKEGKYIYSRIVYFPNWNMYFLYVNKKFVQMDTNLDVLLLLAKEAREKIDSRKLIT